MEGDDHGEAYTAIEWSGLLSRERYKPAGAETVENVEGNMLRTVMRGATALPWSKTPLRSKGTRRNLGDLMPPAVATAIPGRFGKVRSRSRIGRYEESDGCIVPVKPRTTPTDRRVAESVEGRRPVEGRARANACSGPRAGIRMSPTACVHGPELDGPPKPRMPVASDLRQEPGADTEGAAKQKAARRDLRGGREVTPAPTATCPGGCRDSADFRVSGTGR